MATQQDTGRPVILVDGLIVIAVLNVCCCATLLVKSGVVVVVEAPTGFARDVRIQYLQPYHLPRWISRDRWIAGWEKYSSARQSGRDGRTYSLKLYYHAKARRPPTAWDNDSRFTSLVAFW